MWGTRWTAEDYGAWRRERVEEAADLARCASYNDLAGWHRIQEIYAEVRRARGDEGLPGLLVWMQQTLQVVGGRLMHLGVRVSKRHSEGRAG